MEFKEKAVSVFRKVAFNTKKYSPEILTGVAVISGVAATGFAIYGTFKMDAVLEKHEENMKKIEKAKWVAENDPDKDISYSEEDQKRDTIMVYSKTVMGVVGVYMPTIVFSVISVASTLAAHNVLSKRNAAIMSAFAVVSEKFKDYRGRVVEEYGEEKDQEFYRGYKEVKSKNEKGKTVTKKEKVETEAPGYTRYFDEFSPYWDDRNPGMNVAMLRSNIQTANYMLQRDGHLLLNDVYRLFGLEDTTEGCVVGWILDKDHPSTNVDFGVYGGVTDDPWDFESDRPWDGVLGIQLTFNPTGIIYDKI